MSSGPDRAGSLLHWRSWLVGAAGFRNVVAHAYESLDMRRVHRAASDGPEDLRAFFTALRDRVV